MYDPDDNDCADCPSVLTELENIDDEADMFGTLYHHFVNDIYDPFTCAE